MFFLSLSYKINSNNGGKAKNKLVGHCNETLILHKDHLFFFASEKVNKKNFFLYLQANISIGKSLDHTFQLCQQDFDVTQNHQDWQGRLHFLTVKKKKLPNQTDKFIRSQVNP